MKPTAGTTVVVRKYCISSFSLSLSLKHTIYGNSHNQFRSLHISLIFRVLCDVVKPQSPELSGFVFARCLRCFRLLLPHIPPQNKMTRKYLERQHEYVLQCCPNHHTIDRVAPKNTLTLSVRKKSQCGERAVPWKRRLLLPTRPAYALQDWSIAAGTYNEAKQPGGRRVVTTK